MRGLFVDPAPDRVPLNLADGLRRVVDPEDVYYLEADGGETRVRLRSAKSLVDVRELGEVVPHRQGATH